MAEGSFEDATLRVFRGDKESGAPVDYRVPLVPGMVVLDALHSIQSRQAPDLAVRWNCKAGKCGSCSAEVNGRPRLTCKTRMDSLPLDEPITIFPMKAFPVIKDLVTDVSWNFTVNQKIPPFQPRPGVEWKMYQRDVATAYRSFANALSVSFARTSAMSCATTASRNSLAAPGSLYAPPRLKCIRSTASPVRTC